MKENPARNTWLWPKKKNPKKRGPKPALSKPDYRNCTICRSKLPLTGEYFYECEPKHGPVWGHLYSCKNCTTNLEPVKRFYRWKKAGKKELPYLLYRLQIMTRAKEIISTSDITPVVALRQAIEELRELGREVRSI